MNKKKRIILKICGNQIQNIRLEDMVPLVSKIRYLYTLGILSYKIIMNEGFVCFLSKLKEKMEGGKRTYDLWILKNEPFASKLEQYKKEVKSFEYLPKIS